MMTEQQQKLSMLRKLDLEFLKRVTVSVQINS